MTQSNSESIRRVAILVAALDPDTADNLLDQMPADTAARVRRTIMEMGEIDPAQERDVIGAFMSRENETTGSLRRRDAAIAPSVLSSEDEGVELHLSSVTAERSLCAETPAAPTFQFLHDLDRSQLVRLLESERPQTVALIAARLPEDRAAGLLAELKPELQAEVRRRFADCEETDPMLLHEIEISIRARIADCVPTGARSSEALHKISRVLSAADAQSQVCSEVFPLERPIVATPSLAPATIDPWSLRLTFDDLEHLDEELLTATLAHADSELTHLALAGATSTFVQKVFNRLPLLEARALRRSIETLGPTRLSDIERAQQELAHLAESLMNEALRGPQGTRAANI